MVGIHRIMCYECNLSVGASRIKGHYKLHHSDVEYPLKKMQDQLFWQNVVSADGMECWKWIGRLNDSGYGTFFSLYKGYMAHRWSYETLIGPIPEGLVLDHLCRTRDCVNPWHLEPVTTRVNVMRGEGFAPQWARRTHCPYGHPRVAENTYIDPRRGTKSCSICNKRRTDEYNSRRKSRARTV